MEIVRVLKQVWLHKVMVSGLVRRDLRTRYAGSALGMLWTVLQPLLHFGLYFFVFSWILQVKFTENASGGDFAFYLLSGLLPWLSFQESVTRAASAIVEHANLVRGVRFPSAVLVLGSILASLVNFFIGLGLLCLVLLLANRLSWATLPFLPLLVMLQTVFATGLGLLAASIHTFLRDTSQVLTIGFQIWFYLTPIIYPPSYIPDGLAFLFLWNPFTGLVASYRAILIEGAWPSALALAPLLVWALSILAVGSLIFRRVEPGFADVL